MAGFKLPVLTHDVDCEPLGYPGLVVTFRLNPGYVEKAFPWDDIENVEEQNKARAKALETEPWCAEYSWAMSRVIESVTFPADMSEDGKSYTVGIDSPQAFHELTTTEGFDQNIITWAQSGFQKARQEWLATEVKN